MCRVSDTLSVSVACRFGIILRLRRACVVCVALLFYWKQKTARNLIVNRDLHRWYIFAWDAATIDPKIGEIAERLNNDTNNNGSIDVFYLLFIFIDSSSR